MRNSTRRCRGFVVVLLLLAGCAHTTARKDLLIGAWRSTHEAFDIRDKVILYEFDMQEHPYTLEGALLTVDLGPDSGINRSKILKLSDTTLVLQYLETGAIQEFTRMK